MAAITPINAYKTALPTLEGLPGATQESIGPSFGEFLKDTANSQVSALQTFEKAVNGSMTGEVQGLNLIHDVNTVEMQLATFKLALEKSLDAFKTLVEKTAL